MSRYERAVVLLWSMLAIVVVLVWTCGARADEPATVALQAGQPAPYAGQLVPPLRAARLAVAVDTCEARTALEVKRVDELAKADLAYALRLADVAKQAADAQQRMMREALERERLRWYQRPEFVATVSIIGGALAVLLGAIALDYAEDQK